MTIKEKGRKQPVRKENIIDQGFDTNKGFRPLVNYIFLIFLRPARAYDADRKPANLAQQISALDSSSSILQTYTRQPLQ